VEFFGHAIYRKKETRPTFFLMSVRRHVEMVVNRMAENKHKRVRYPGIVAAARELGVSRIHLYYVLRGERKSPRIEAWLSKHMQEVRP